MKIFQMNAVKRTLIVWIGFQALLWLVFGISYLVHKDAWVNVREIDSQNAAVGGFVTTFLYIVGMNLLICIGIIVGNIFVRFGWLTPGLIILVIQAISIGWLAGSNNFEVPFMSVREANIEYLKVGLWETTTYALVCAVTLTKSLLISNTFPAKEWAETHKLKDLSFNKSEIIILTLAGVSLLSAALVETVAIIN